MAQMFDGCTSLKEINLSNFNTNNVNDMRGMFCRCSSLKEINIPNFNTNYFANMSSMFYGCPDELITKIKSHFQNPTINFKNLIF